MRVYRYICSYYPINTDLIVAKSPRSHVRPILIRPYFNRRRNELVFPFSWYVTPLTTP